MYIIGTGNPYNIEDPMLIHAGTAYDGLFVWHVFVGSPDWTARHESHTASAAAAANPKASPSSVARRAPSSREQEARVIRARYEDARRRGMPLVVSSDIEIITLHGGAS